MADFIFPAYFVVHVSMIFSMQVSSPRQTVKIESTSSTYLQFEKSMSIILAPARHSTIKASNMSVQICCRPVGT